ncbi:MAG: hypothetical protein JWR00_1521 [Rubritepida sp.]|nr:hypothetical protein [Rubritepida sp.]
MSLLLRSWPLLLALGVSACASGAAPSFDACAPAAAMLGRQMAESGVAPPGAAPRRAEMMAALRLANLHLQLSQDAASRLFECRAAEAQAVREDQAAGHIWRVTAEFRIARIRSALGQEIEAALVVSERIGAADAALVAAALTQGAATEVRQEAELRRLVAANIALRESFGATVLLAGQITDIEMDRDRTSR